VIPVEIRQFPIEDYVKIDGMDEYITKAVYMADCLNVEGNYAICGDVVFIEEIEYTRHNEKTGEDVQKTRFSVAITDGTGTIRCTYFPKKATVDKVREIKIGDALLKNVEASVVLNQQAPLLLGQSVLERFGTITIDNINSKLLIKQ
jgi:hypothetical protein